MTATPDQRWQRLCGSFTARTEKVYIRKPQIAGFNELYLDGRITEATCWARARRKIHDVHVRTPSALTEEALSRLGELHSIEADVRGMSAERGLQHCQGGQQPLRLSPVDTFHQHRQLRWRQEHFAIAG